MYKAGQTRKVVWRATRKIFNTKHLKLAKQEFSRPAPIGPEYVLIH